MKKRLFLALPITAGMVPKIARLEKETKKKTGFSVPWIPLKNLHLTILFLSWQGEEEIVKITKLFDNYPFGMEILKFSISCVIEKFDYGPPGGNRMIWLYFKKNERLEKLHQLWQEILRENEIPFKEEQRVFLPHINLARLKVKKSTHLPKIKEELNWGIKFNKLVLFQSILKRPFVEYVPLKEIKLIEKQTETWKV